MKKPTILYIDDDIYSLLLIKEQLKNYDIDVITETNGKLGLLTYSKLKEQIDLAIVDLALPYMNGYEVLSKIKKEKNIPVIIMTANNSIDEKELSMKRGADNFYVKPIKIENTLSIIDKYVKVYDL